MSEELNLQEAIIKNAEIVEKFLRSNNAPDSYDEESLKWLEAYIFKNRETFSKAEADNMVNLIGSFLGECVRRKYGGKWQQTENSIAIEIEGIQGFPFATTARVMSGEEFKSIVSFYRSLPAVIEHSKKPTSDKQDDNNK